MKRRFLHFSIVWLLSISVAFSLKLDNLYSVTLPASSQNATERAQLLQQGFAQVLVKVSGSSKILDDPEIKKKLNTANTLLQEYRYSTNPNIAKPYLLKMTFDPQGVRNFLQERGLSIWSQNRPLLLVWLAYQAPHSPAEIISDGSQQPISSSILKQSADARGLPLLFPLMDMTEMNQVTADDINHFTIPALNVVSKRYNTEGMLIGQIELVAGMYQSHWQLILGKNQWRWDINGQSIDVMLTTIVDYAANTLATKFASTQAPQQNILAIKVTGISQADDFGQLMNYLQHLALVTAVEPIQIRENEVVMKVKLNGERQSFIQMVALGQHLMPMDETDELVYQWNR